MIPFHSDALILYHYGNSGTQSSGSKKIVFLHTRRFYDVAFPFCYAIDGFMPSRSDSRLSFPNSAVWVPTTII